MKSNLPIRKFEKKGWFWIDNLLHDELAAIIGWKATAVYFALARYADKNQYCFPSQKTLAAKLKVSESTIKRGMAVLISHNMVYQQRKGKKLNNGYWLLDKTCWTKNALVKGLTELSLAKSESSDFRKVKVHGEPQQGSHSTTNDKRIKETNNNEVANIKKYRNIKTELFEPANNHELIAKEVAVEFGDTNMDFLLYVLRTYGVEIIQRAAGICREKRSDTTLQNPAAYLNSVIRTLTFDSKKGGNGLQ